MWFDGMGTLLAIEYLQVARENIEKAIQSCERDYAPCYLEKVEKLRAALELL